MDFATSRCSSQPSSRLTDIFVIAAAVGRSGLQLLDRVFDLNQVS